MVRAAYYVLLVAAFWLALSHLGGTEKYAQLARDGVPAEAVVVRPDCANHATFVYRFEVGGRDFESRDHSSSGGRKCDSLRVGEIVGVFYLPTDPSVNMVGNPQNALRSERAFVLVASLVMPGFIVWAFVRRRRLQVDA
jgi:hypothetical protein